MSTLHFDQTTTATPEQFIAGLTDFGPGRSKAFPNIADAELTVHHRGTREGTVNLSPCRRSTNNISLIGQTRPGESRRRTWENRPRIAQKS